MALCVYVYYIYYVCHKSALCSLYYDVIRMTVGVACCAVVVGDNWTAERRYVKSRQCEYLLTTVEPRFETP